MDRARRTALVAALLAWSGCDVAPDGEVPPFSGGADVGGTGDAESESDSSGGSGNDDDADDGGSGALDDGDDAADGGDSGGGIDGGPLDDDAGDSGGSDDGATTGPAVEPPPFEPLYRVATRVHMAASNLTDIEISNVLAEMNFIWRSQAGICFEFEVVQTETVMSDGFDMWFKPDVGGPNGYYAGDHDIHVRDQPSLGSAPNPAMIGTARTAAHELGHGLTLDHDQGSDDYLMRSGTMGWNIPMYQIDAARQRASEKAIADMTPLDCAMPVFN